MVTGILIAHCFAFLLKPMCPSPDFALSLMIAFPGEPCWYIYNSVILQGYNQHDVTSVPFRRSALDVNKPFKCQVPGCNKSFFASQSLRFHENQKHGRQPKFKRCLGLFSGVPQDAQGTDSPQPWDSNWGALPFGLAHCSGLWTLLHVWSIAWD